MSEELKIDATEDTPLVHFCRSAGTFLISGRSLPEDAFWFYNPVHEWLADYAKHSLPETVFHFKLEYYNTASAKQIFKIINCLADLSKNADVKIKWHYDEGDKDMMASGERFSKLCSIPIEITRN